MLTVDEGANGGILASGLPLSCLHPLIFTIFSKHDRAAVGALWQLDRVLAQQLQLARDPVLTAMRLLWWEQQIEQAASGAIITQHPVLDALVANFDPHALKPIAALPAHWAQFAETEPLGVENIEYFAAARGRILFEQTARIIKGKTPLVTDLVHQAGRYWALIDVASHLSDPRKAAAIFSLASAPIEGRLLPKPLAALMMLARMRAGSQGTIRPVAEQLAILRLSLFRG